ncbi:MAG: ABC transporter substrate-binding protein [Thermomicrobiales bacterium]
MADHRTSGHERDEALARISRRGFVGGAAASAAALAVGGPQLAGAAPGVTSSVRALNQADDSTIIIGTLGEAHTINPFLTDDSEGDWRCKMLFDEFVHINPKNYAPEPGIAAEWTLDNLTYTFKLQPNAKFSDGSDVTADDVAFTIKGFLPKEVGAVRQSKYLTIEGASDYADGKADDVSGIKVIDPKTLSVTLAKPDAPFLFNMRYIWVVPKAQLEGKDLTNDPFFEKPIGAGPYVFQKWDRDADFVATKNPNYWQTGKPAIASFTHRTIPDANSLVLALQSKDIDASNYPAPTAKDELAKDEDLNIVIPPFASPNGWMFNLAHEWLGKKEVRTAIAMAINTKQFAADSLLGIGKPGNGPIAPDSWAYDKDLKPIPYDVEGAKALIAKAGMPDGTKIRFMVNQGNVLREDWLTFSQQALKEIGIDVVPEDIEYATLVDRVTKNKDYDATGVDFAGVTADPSELYDQFYSTSQGNYMNYKNPELDDLLTAAREELDMEKAKDLYKQIQAIIVADVPMFYAWYRPFLHVVRKGYEGYEDSDSAAFGMFQTLEDWTYTGS